MSATTTPSDPRNVAAAAGRAALTPPRELVVRGARVLDEEGGFTSGVDVHVRDGEIVAVDRNPRGVAPGAVELDAAGLWLMPGIFDCHLHVAMSTTDMAANLQRPITRWALEAAVNARTTIEAGITFVRDACGADAGLRDAIACGEAVGPELQVSIVMIGQTGGHADGFLPGTGDECFTHFLIPDHPARPPFLVDGPEAMRRVVREVLRAGADWIKLCGTGGLVSTHDSPLESELSREEIAIAVQEAARRGRGVMVHAYGGAGIDDAIAAGVRSIEHGSFLTEAQAAAMARAGCWLVPTLCAYDDLLAWAERGELAPQVTEKVRAHARTMDRCVAIAQEHGVRIATGTDFISRAQHGSNLRELALLRRAGMRVEDVLLAATANGAELCGVGDRLGRIAPGYQFDAILLDEEPSDLDLFMARRSPVTGVFKNGVAVVPHERWPQRPRRARSSVTG